MSELFFNTKKLNYKKIVLNSFSLKKTNSLTNRLLLITVTKRLFSSLALFSKTHAHFFRLFISLIMFFLLNLLFINFSRDTTSWKISFELTTFLKKNNFKKFLFEY